MFAVLVKSRCNGKFTRCSQENLRIKKRASGAFSPDIDPYSRETKETSIDKPIRMSRYLERKSESPYYKQKLQNFSKPLHPKIAVIFDLSEHVDVDDDPEEAEQRGMMNFNLQR